MRDSLRCPCLAQQKKARAMARRFDGVLRPLGLTNTQLSMLMLISEQPSSISELADELSVDRSTLSTNLTRLKKNDWISIAASTEDARSKIVSLNPNGIEKLTKGREAWVKLVDEIDASEKKRSLDLKKVFRGQDDVTVVEV